MIRKYTEKAIKLNGGDFIQSSLLLFVAGAAFGAARFAAFSMAICLQSLFILHLSLSIFASKVNWTRGIRTGHLADFTGIR